MRSYSSLDLVPVKMLKIAALLLVALLTGLSFAHVLERPAKMSYDAGFYIALQKSLYAQWGPPQIGGILEPAAIITTGLLAFFVRTQKRAIACALGALALLLLAFPIVFFWLVAPANAAFLATKLPTVPPNWTGLRSNWELGHAIRFALQFSALALLGNR